MLRILSYDTNDVDDMFDAMQKVVKDIQKKNSEDSRNEE